MDKQTAAAVFDGLARMVRRGDDTHWRGWIGWPEDGAPTDDELVGLFEQAKRALLGEGPTSTTPVSR